MIERRSRATSSGAVTASSDPASNGAGDTEARRFPPGSVIDGRFEIGAVLGHGGMGYVLAARHRELDEPVALKLLLPNKADGTARQRMLREAQNAAKIKSEHSVRVFDVVNSGPSAPYIVMELLRGESFAQRLSRGEPLPVEEVVDVVLQACEAVGEAHQLGIVHRDLKPSNLFLIERPGQPSFVKVLDFGVSKRSEEDPAHELTHSRALLGSPVYAPPEQLRASRRVDGRADIWALGTILYQGLTQKLPFRGATLAEVCTRILQDPPPPPRALRPEIPRSLETTILRCLEKRPEQRFGSVEELALSLREFAPATAAKTLIYLDALRAPADRAVGPPRPGAVDEANALTFSPSTLGDESTVQTPRRGARVALALGISVAGAIAGLAAIGAFRPHISTPKGGPAAHTGSAVHASAPSAPAAAVPASAASPSPSTPAEPPYSPPNASTMNAARVAPMAHAAVSAPLPRKTAKRSIHSSPATESRPWVDSR